MAEFKYDTVVPGIRSFYTDRHVLLSFEFTVVVRHVCEE
jgi:hypothetical protein